MKKLVTFRFDPKLLEQARKSAEAENRSLTNFIETLVRRSVEGSGASPPASGDAPSPQIKS